MEHLTSYRAAHGLTQQQLADILATSCGYLHDIESGRRKPSPVLVHRIEQITGISRHDLRPDVFGPAPSKPEREVA